MLTMTASVTARTIAAQTTTGATCGLSAPNSFEIRLLQSGKCISSKRVLGVKLLAHRRIVSGREI